MFKLVDRAGLPEGMKNAIRSMYNTVLAYSAENTIFLLYEVLSGILQGFAKRNAVYPRHQSALRDASIRVSDGR